MFYENTEAKMDDQAYPVNKLTNLVKKEGITCFKYMNNMITKKLNLASQ